MILFIGLLLIVVVGIAMKINHMRKWTLFYSAFGYKDYLKIKAKLDHIGVHTRTKYPNLLGEKRSVIKDSTQYDVYVKREEKHKAAAALRK